MRKFLLSLMLLFVVTPALAVLDAPANFTCTYVAEWPRLQFAWDAVVGVHHYEIYKNGLDYTDRGTQRSLNESPNQAIPGKPYTYQVAAVEADGTVGILSTACIKSFPIVPRVGIQNVLIALVDYTDYDIPYDPNFILGIAAEMHDYYLAESDGQLDLRFTITEWRDMGHPLSDYDCGTVPPPCGILAGGGLKSGARTRALTDAKPFFPETDDYDWIIWHLNGTSETGGATRNLYSDGHVKGEVAISPTFYGLTNRVYTHEFGHSMNLPHIGDTYPVAPNVNPVWPDLLIPDEVQWKLDDYDTISDTMGSVDPPAPFQLNSYHKWFLGWGPAPKIAPTSGGRFDLWPTEDPHVTGPIGLWMPLGDARYHMYYVIEYHSDIQRVQIFFRHTDMNIVSSNAYGSQMHHFYYGTDFPKKGLKPGDSFFDSWRNIRITYVKKTAGVAEIQITTANTNVGMGNGQKTKYVDTAFSGSNP